MASELLVLPVSANTFRWHPPSSLDFEYVVTSSGESCRASVYYELSAPPSVDPASVDPATLTKSTILPSPQSAGAVLKAPIPPHLLPRLSLALLNHESGDAGEGRRGRRRCAANAAEGKEGGEGAAAAAAVAKTFSLHRQACVVFGELYSALVALSSSSSSSAAAAASLSASSRSALYSRPCPLLPVPYYSGLVAALSALGWSRLSAPSSSSSSSSPTDLSSFSLEYTSALGQLHVLHVSVTSSSSSSSSSSSVSRTSASSSYAAPQPPSDYSSKRPRTALEASAVDASCLVSLLPTVDLPVPFPPAHLRLFGPISETLPPLYSSFASTVESLSSCFSNLSSIDSDLWVIDPPLPCRRSALERRVVLGGVGVSLALKLDPRNPQDPPASYRVLGANNSKATSSYSDESAAKGGRQQTNDGALGRPPPDTSGWGSSDFRARLDSYLAAGKWSDKKPVTANLADCFGSLPARPAAEEGGEPDDDFEPPCGICYGRRLAPEGGGGGGGDDDRDDKALDAGTLPDVVCGTATCRKAFHEACLFEWLHALPGARVTFDRVFGTCPYCCEAMSVKVRAAGAD